MSEQCSYYTNTNICIMYIESTIHPYHQIVKSKVHQNQPFLKSICYYIRIEERERERKGRKEEKNGHNIQLYFLRANPKSRLFQNVKKVPTIGIPKIGQKTRFLEFQKYGLFLHRFRFLEFHLYSIFDQFSNQLNSKNRHYFQNFRFVYFQEYFLFLKQTDFWNSNSMDYLVSIPISGIPKIWKLQVYQYLAMRVKCEIVPWYLKIPIFVIGFDFPHLVVFRSTKI